MAGNFLNLDEDELEPVAASQIGSELKRKPKMARPRADPAAVAAAGKAHGFDRTTNAATPSQVQRRGRPPINEDMTYWRIYVSADFRDQLSQLRDEEGRRLNDLLVDMMAAYRKAKHER